MINMEGSYDDEAITWTKGEILGRGAYGTVSHNHVHFVKLLFLKYFIPAQEVELPHTRVFEQYLISGKVKKITLRAYSLYESEVLF